MHFTHSRIAPQEPVVPGSAPAVPATGDSASPALWLSLMLAAAVCMTLLRRVKHA